MDRKKDIRRSDRVLLRDTFHDGIRQQGRCVRAKRGVGSDNDSPFTAEGNKVLLVAGSEITMTVNSVDFPEKNLYVRVKFNLVDSRNNGGLLQEWLEEIDGNVRDTDGSDFLRMRLEDSLHGLPGIDPVVFSISCAIRCSRCRPVHQPWKMFSILPLTGSRYKRRTKIKVSRVQSLQGALESLGGGSVVGVVELGHEEKLFSFETGSLDAMANLGFVA